jgi:hypothetical protein
MTEILVPLAVAAAAALLIWKRWQRATVERRVDVSDLGGGLAGIVGSSAALVIAWAIRPSGQPPWAMIGTAIGAAAGAAAAFVSLRTTTYDVRRDGLYYRPDPRIGIPMFVVLVAVLAVKAVHVLGALELAGAIRQPDLAGAALAAIDPISPILIAMAAAYLGLYQLWLFRRGWRWSLPTRRSVTREEQARPTAGRSRRSRPSRP